MMRLIASSARGSRRPPSRESPHTTQPPAAFAREHILATVLVLCDLMVSAHAGEATAAGLIPTYVTSWGNYVGETWGLAADRHGNLYVPDTENKHVDKYN